LRRIFGRSGSKKDTTKTSEIPDKHLPLENEINADTNSMNEIVIHKEQEIEPLKLQMGYEVTASKDLVNVRKVCRCPF
jgi:hypothetical protein